MAKSNKNAVILLIFSTFTAVGSGQAAPARPVWTFSRARATHGYRGHSRLPSF